MGALICIFVLIAFAVLLRVCLAPRARRERREREEREARERIEAAAAKEREIRRSWRTGMLAVQPDGEHIVGITEYSGDQYLADELTVGDPEGGGTVRRAGRRRLRRRSR